MIYHENFESAKSWAEEEKNRVTFLLDDNCSSCKEWIDEFNTIEGWEFSYMNLNDFRENSEEPITNLRFPWVRIGLSAIFKESDVKKMLESVF